MNTYSHVLVAAVVNRVQKGRTTFRVPAVQTWPLLLGSFLPDMPLIALTIGLIGYDWLGGSPLYPAGVGYSSSVQYLFDHLFFESVLVKTLHNVFHAPLLTLAYTAVGYLAWRRNATWGAALFWFGLSTCLHTAADIPLHYDDGPLLLFPFNLSVRFYSPLSYWDPARYGLQWAIFEHLLDLGLIVYLVRGRRRLSKTQDALANKT
ncbi:MAG: hypothetical protein OT477_09985 [Chloroflexi bacterium]|nr:hypothetical protein [Chloroflexota bacterium]